MHTKTATWWKRAAMAAVAAGVAVAVGCSSGGGGIGDAGGDATSACSGASTLCAGTCVDVQTDNANCGACGTACPSGEVCSQGKCATSCGGGTKLCGSICADTKNDPQNCGGCGTKCASGEVCSNGACGSTCASGQTLCGGDGGAPYCASTQTDNANCGACGNACGAGQVCSGGTCQSSCGGDDAGAETFCTPEGGAPYCASTKTDNANCGGCGIVCGTGQVCENGACANGCAAADGGVETLCMPDGGAPYCANTATDNANCGGCGVACTNAQVCIGGTCKTGVCPPFDGAKSQAGPHVEYGFCWYVTTDGETCDHACSALGGTNLAVSAQTAWADSCSAAAGGDISTWFYNNGNPGGWVGTGTTAYHTLGYGYRGQQYYGKCSSGTFSGNGSYPGDTNSSATRSIVCPCFAAP